MEMETNQLLGQPPKPTIANNTTVNVERGSEDVSIDQSNNVDNSHGFATVEKSSNQLETTDKDNPIVDTKESSDQSNTSNEVDNDMCVQLDSDLNLDTWPSIMYHKDLDPNEHNTNYDSVRFASVEEDDEQARSTLKEFNDLRSSVLTRELVNSGFELGSKHRAKMFTQRFLESSQGKDKLVIMVFGNSFTIGSNCGESSVQNGHECAWPRRLDRRWKEIITHTFCAGKSASNCEIEWRMLQENAQGSVNIAQKIPTILNDFSSKNTTPDAILMNNLIVDGRAPTWFEAVVRVFAQTYPAALMVSLIDGLTAYVNPSVDSYEDNVVKQVREVQRHYGLLSVDFAKMVEILQSNNSVDMLWPQSYHMISSNGTHLDDLESMKFSPTNPVYWANFLPKTRKTKSAYYPVNHPPVSGSLGY